MGDQTSKPPYIPLRPGDLGRVICPMAPEGGGYTFGTEHLFFRCLYLLGLGKRRGGCEVFSSRNPCIIFWSWSRPNKHVFSFRTWIWILKVYRHGRVWKLRVGNNSTEYEEKKRGTRLPFVYLSDSRYLLAVYTLYSRLPIRSTWLHCSSLMEGSSCKIDAQKGREEIFPGNMVHRHRKMNIEY